ncbi:glycosyltransferase protein [Spatholobus suberectus]|nr:glycosyltransferase protein [Spatholobus suberectus]
MKICRRRLFLFETLLLFLSLIVIEWVLPWQLMRFTDSNPEYSDPLHHFRRQVSGENQLRAVGDAAHSNNNITREVARVKSREEMREEGLARARASMRIAALAGRNLTPPTAHDKDIPAGTVYRNPRLFYRSYLEMEKIFKVYVYPEGDLPIVHDGPCKDIYSIEGRFLHEMEHGVGRFRTNDPTAAHLYFLPFSVTWMVKYLYTPNSYDITPLKHFVSDYVRVIFTKYPFWNKTHGADHFMVACHDWGPYASEGNPFLYNTSIRVLCNANTSEGFNPLKDVTLPEIYLYGGEVSPKLLSPPPDNGPRRYLAFFAGGMHGPIRPILLHHWKNRDNDIRVHEYLPKDLDYYSFMLSSNSNTHRQNKRKFLGMQDYLP